MLIIPVTSHFGRKKTGGSRKICTSGKAQTSGSSSSTDASKEMSRDQPKAWNTSLKINAAASGNTSTKAKKPGALSGPVQKA